MNSYCDENDIIRILRKAYDCTKYSDFYDELTEIIQIMTEEFSDLLDITDNTKFVDKIMKND